MLKKLAMFAAQKLSGQGKTTAKKLLIKLNQEQNLKTLQHIKKILLKLEVRYRKNLNL